MNNQIKQIGHINPKSNNSQAGRIYDTDFISPTLTTCQGGNKQPFIIDDTYGYDGIRVYKENVPTLRSERNGLKVTDGIRIRKLTPVECWKLMGFDADDCLKCRNAGISDTQLYKQAGNSIVVNVIEGILKELIANDDSN